jgi:hypothetical protein
LLPFVVTTVLAWALTTGLPELRAQATSRAQSADAATTARQKALQEGGIGAPLTLLPVRVLGRPTPQVAEALGLVLERQGMADLEVAEKSFDPGAKASWEEMPLLLKAYVQQLAATAKPGGARRYQLYAEFLGEPKTGPKEVRFLLADAAGDVVLSDRQTPADPDFQRTAARDPDPLGCSVLVAERLSRLASWKKAAGTVRDGKFSAKWREKSGVPDQAELSAMDKRRDALRAGLAKARVAVLPTLALAKHDAASALRVAELIKKDLGCGAVALEDGARLEVGPSSNEQKRLWDLAHALRAALGKHPVDADYALVADLNVRSEGGGQFVHVALCTKSGEHVLVDYQNDQHAMFQQHAPKTIEDAERLVVSRLASLLR